MELPPDMLKRIEDFLSYSMRFNEIQKKAAIEKLLENPLEAMGYYLRIEGYSYLIPTLTEFCKRYANEKKILPNGTYAHKT